LFLAVAAPAEAAVFAFRNDGWIHFVVEGQNLARGPLGVLLYVLFVPLYGYVPQAHRASYLSITSLLLALGTVGPGYTATLAILALFSLGIVRQFGTPSKRWSGTALLALVYSALLVHPQPPWLPAIHTPEPLYFYLHWAGIGYLFLRTYHVLADVALGRLEQPGLANFSAYLLFAPTLRMGPIYRYRAFAEQLADGPAQHRNLLSAFGRLVTGLVRLGILGVVLKELPLDRLFHEPQTLSTGQLIFGLYWAPMSFYLWVSGYVDLSIAVGKVLGFTIPDNFAYPWKATNIAEFWQRWHITLSEWLRDYLFLQMIRKRWPVAVSYVSTFLFCGLWHAPIRCYLLWGLTQGVGLAIRRMWLDYWKHQRNAKSPKYQILARARLVDSPLSAGIGWLVTFHYLMFTLTIGVDVAHAGLRFFRQLYVVVGIG